MSVSPILYTCEICGLEGFSDEEMRAHTLTCHVQGHATCPFCDLSDVPSDEMLLHVNQAHLDFLTPEAELMVFIDDQSPAFDEDSDTVSSCRGYSGHTPCSTQNGWHTPTANGHAAGAHKDTPQGHSRSSSQSSLASTASHSTGIAGSKRSGPSHSHKTVSNGAAAGRAAPAMRHNKNKSKSKETSRQSSTESVTSHSNHTHNHNATKHDYKNNSGNNSGSEYELSPASSKVSLSGAGQGSPLRSQLALKLKANTPNKVQAPTMQCLMCTYMSDSASRLEEHMNRAHFDLTSPSLTNNSNSNSNSTSTGTTSGAAAPLAEPETTTTTSSLHCPLCERSFDCTSNLEIHVNVQHRDILSPQKDVAAGGTETDKDRDKEREKENQEWCLERAESLLMESSPEAGALVCPVCCQTLPNCTTQQDMTKHIEEHFDRDVPPTTNSGSVITDQQREVQRHREQREFEMLRAQYGMDEQGNYGQQAARGLRRAVYTGELSVRDYYERKIGLKRAESDGVDDSTSCTKGILSRIQSMNAQNPSILKTYLCSAVDHYASTYGDRGWGCGFRNMQMLISSLVESAVYSEAVYEGAWRACTQHRHSKHAHTQHARTAVPSISRLQLMVEHAWKLGFDTQGAEQLGSKLHNTRKWIGACEVVTVLSSMRIRCQLIDFHRPTSSDGGHPALFSWVLNYFQENPDEFKPPLYLQHQGHSRTIIGCEVCRGSGAGTRLLVLDPSHGPAQLQATPAALRRAAPALHAKQYQLVAVRGLMQTSQEYEASKVLRSVRIPHDR